MRREDGQATVEFALILPVMLLVIVGLISFGKAFNYWIDLNHLANEGARWAVVNKVPPSNTAPTPDDLRTYLTTQVVDSQELKDKITSGYTTNCANGSTFCWCWGTAGDGKASPDIGDPIRVKVTVPYSLSIFQRLPSLLDIKLTGQSTLRLEQLPTNAQLASWTHC